MEKKNELRTELEKDAFLKEVLGLDYGNHNYSGKKTSVAFKPIESNDTQIIPSTAEKSSAVVTLEPAPTINAPMATRISAKQRKLSLEEYKQDYLIVPKIQDRKPVFISSELRDELDDVVRKLGEKKMSASGFIENLVMQHLSTYREDIEKWKKL